MSQLYLYIIQLLRILYSRSAKLFLIFLKLSERLHQLKVYIWIFWIDYLFIFSLVISIFLYISTINKHSLSFILLIIVFISSALCIWYKFPLLKFKCVIKVSYLLTTVFRPYQKYINIFRRKIVQIKLWFNAWNHMECVIIACRKLCNHFFRLFTAIILIEDSSKFFSITFKSFWFLVSILDNSRLFYLLDSFNPFT